MRYRLTELGGRNEVGRWDRQLSMLTFGLLSVRVRSRLATNPASKFPLKCCHKALLALAPTPYRIWNFPYLILG